MRAEKKLNLNGHSIFYQIIGDGKPVLFIHGFGEDGEVWKAPSYSPGGELNAQTSIFDDPSLLEKFKFIIPDLPGSGKSEMIDDMSMEGMAEVMKEILNIETPLLKEAVVNNTDIAKSEVSEWVFSTIGGNRMGAVLIGHSMGGYIALAFAEKYPEYLNGLGLFHSSAYADTEEKKATRRKGIQFINEQGAFEFLETANYNLFSQLSKDKMPELIDEFISRLRNFRAEALVSYYEAMMKRPNRITMLKNMKIPMLFIAGKYDNAIPLNDILEQCHLPEISYFHILAESGHMGMIEEAEKSNRILNDYLINLS
jgi:pimeloyl-ACP methyl ester carboxylesterase